MTEFAVPAWLVHANDTMSVAQYVLLGVVSGLLALRYTVCFLQGSYGPSLAGRRYVVSSMGVWGGIALACAIWATLYFGRVMHLGLFLTNGAFILANLLTMASRCMIIAGAVMTLDALEMKAFGIPPEGILVRYANASAAWALMVMLALTPLFF